MDDVKLYVHGVLLLGRRHHRQAPATVSSTSPAPTTTERNHADQGNDDGRSAHLVVLLNALLIYSF